MEKMGKIRTLTSETDLQQEFLANFRQNHSIDQKFFYLDEGIEVYDNKSRQYVRNGENTHTAVFHNSYWPFFKKNFPKKDQHFAFISMGCGSAFREKSLLEEMKNAGYSFAYHGVDSSARALELARDELADLDIEKHFFCVDFGKNQFYEHINEFLKGFDTRIYAFFGGTIANLEPFYVADIMNNVMQPGDILWSDVAARDQEKPPSMEDHRLWLRYLEYTQNPREIDLMAIPLKSLNIPLEKGIFKIRLTPNKDIANTVKIQFYFEIEKELQFTYRGLTLRLTPPQEINLYKVQVFDGESLRQFFDKHNLTLLDSDKAPGREQHFFVYNP